MFKEKGFAQARKTRPAAAFAHPAAKLNFATFEARVHLLIQVTTAAADPGVNAFSHDS